MTTLKLFKICLRESRKIKVATQKFITLFDNACFLVKQKKKKKTIEE